ncbi:MAG: TetR/AcrR family transcriptional regulator [Spirochaetes bacterium]|nr:TetR/AcrR family transcriptional regulator [Spirochaetota bacterium]
MDEKKTHLESTFSKLKKREKDLRKQIIIEAAEKLFASKPFHKVSMRDIAKEAGISASAIYRHFPDQKSLFLESFSRGTLQLKNEFDAMLAQNKKPSIDIFAERFIEYFTEKDQYFRMMINFFLEGPVDAEMFYKLSDIERTLLQQFDEVFIRMGIKKNVRYYSHALFAALTGIVAIFRSTPDKTFEQIMEHRKRIARIISILLKSAAKKSQSLPP